MVIVEVEDNGVGIPQENLSHIFEPFFTTRAQAGGSGLGLAVCRSIVDSYGGRIEVRSSAGGTKFLVSLPRMTSQTTGAVPDRLDDGLRVLLIDDDPDTLSSLRRAFVGHRVVIANDGKEGLAFALNGGFDVVLYNPNVFGEVDVYQEVIRAGRCDPKGFVLVVGREQDSHTRELVNAFPGLVLAKPCDETALAAIIADRLKNREVKAASDPRPKSKPSMHREVTRP
ncbi:MAG: hypothetical protein IT381_32395, partial [Deltaproteobacteria bacterium]|nr:hypothetical protein [Deltaproteobacteria bacterium]